MGRGRFRGVWSQRSVDGHPWSHAAANDAALAAGLLGTTRTRGWPKGCVEAPASRPGPLIRERTTGLEPATLTLARCWEIRFVGPRAPDGLSTGPASGVGHGNQLRRRGLDGDPDGIRLRLVPPPEPPLADVGQLGPQHRRT
jgi:hypothetical protein